LRTWRNWNTLNYVMMNKKSNYISTKWNKNLAYAIGLFTADGCLSSDKRHLEFNSRDKEQVENFRDCLFLTNKIAKKSRAREKIKKYYHIQFGSTEFYKFLESIGLKARKSKRLGQLDIPARFFPDFLRGFFDGDGSFSIFIHPESNSPQLRIRFTSASHHFLKWLSQIIKKRLDTDGFIFKGKRGEDLTYCKCDSLKLLNFMYYKGSRYHLSRKLRKVAPYILRT